MNISALFKALGLVVAFGLILWLLFLFVAYVGPLAVLIIVIVGVGAWLTTQFYRFFVDKSEAEAARIKREADRAASREASYDDPDY